MGPYVPRLAATWAREPAVHTVFGTLISADISGFTALSERLAGFGREGAEELTILLNRCFGEMIEVAHARGGDILKFGGDALLILFTGAAHTARAAAAAVAMRAVIQKRWSTRLVANVELGISQGIHSGEFSLHLVEGGHLELFVCGPGMSATVTCESSANRGEILLSHDAAAHLEPAALGEPRADGCLLARAPREPGPVALPSLAGADLGPFVPPWLVEQALTTRVAEHRQVAVAFVFFGGADHVLLEFGPAELQRRLNHLAGVVSAAAQQHDAYWLASDVYAGGGKIILSAGAPRSAGQDEDALLRTLRTILDTDVGLPLRAGAHRGPVFMGDLGSPVRRTFTVMGDAVNLAARLMQKSRPGELVASRGMLSLSPTPFALEPLDPFLVKGKTAPIEASLVGPILQEDAEPPQVDVVPYCGREDEMATLRALLDESRHGRGQVVDLVGEAGIGKSRLVAELLANNPDVFTLRTAGGLYARGSPYFAVRTLLRRLAGVSLSTGAAEAGVALRHWVAELDPELLPWLPLIAIAFDAEVPMTPEVERIGAANRAARLRDAAVDLLHVALREPTIIVVDDAYWLDGPSHDLFGALAGRVEEVPWLVLALRRDGLDCFATGQPGATTLALGPLSPGDTAALARAAIQHGVGSDSARIDQLVARGGSNPLFVLELLRTASAAGADAPLPDSIESLVTARIDLLSARSRTQLREASVLGAVVDLALFAESVETPALARLESWSELSTFFEHEAHGSLRFQHALFRLVAYDGLSFRRRAELHGAVGTVLERRAGENWDEFSELLSIHFDRASDWARSWRYSTAAGDRARAKYANEAAAEFYQRGLASARRCQVPSSAVATVAESLGDVSELAGQFTQAAEAYSFASRKTTDPAMLIRLMRKQGVVRERGGRYTQALRWYGRALSQLPQLHDPRDREKAEGEIALATAGVRWRQGRLPDMVRSAHHAEHIATTLGEDAMLAHASYLLDLAYTALRDPRREDYRGRALPLFERVGDLVGQANVLNNLGLAAREDGNWDESLSLYEQSQQARELTGDVVGAATASLNIAEILSDQGHLDRAEPLLRSALEAWKRANYPVGVAVATSYLGRLLARRLDFGAAKDHLEEAIVLFSRIQAGYFVLETRLFLAELALFEARPQDSAAELEQLRPQIVALGDVVLQITRLRLEAWAHYLSGDDARATSLATAAIEQAQTAGARTELAWALYIRSLARHDPADRDAALQILSSLGVLDSMLPTPRGA